MAIPEGIGKMEWYTPGQYLDAARIVFGSEIDLDPASSLVANRVVRAARIYTKEDDGLRQDWTSSTLWLNPPYGRLYGKGGNKSLGQLFTEKLLEEYEAGRVGQALLLSLGNPNSKWFQPLFEFPICFRTGHIDFLRQDGNVGHFGFPNALIYLGPNWLRFVEVFEQFGPVVSKISCCDEVKRIRG